MNSLKRHLIVAFAMLCPTATAVSQSIFWESVNPPVASNESFVRSMVILPDGGIMTTLNSRAMYRSDDLTATWTKISHSGEALRPSYRNGYLLRKRFSFMLYDADDDVWRNAGGDQALPQLDDVMELADGTLFVAASAGLLPTEETGLFRSTDNGASWQQVLDSVGASSIELTADGALLCATNRILGGINGMDIDKPAALFRSTDRGDTWRQAALQDVLVNNWKIWTAPDGLVLITANLDDAPWGRVYRSTDHGKSWSTSTLLDFVWTFVALPDGRLFAAAINSGIHQSGDGGRTWSGASNGLLSSRSLALALHPGGRLFASDWFANLYRSSLPVTSARSTDSEPELTIGPAQPTPASDELAFPIRMPQAGFLRISVYAIDGRLLLTPPAVHLEQGSSTLDLDVSSLAAGVYICRLEQDAFAQQRVVVITR